MTRPAHANGNGTSRWRENLVMLGAIAGLGAAVLSPTIYAIMVLTEAVAEIRRDQAAVGVNAQVRSEINLGRIVALESNVAEQETQHRCSAVVRNLEHQWQLIAEDLLQQCPTCRVMPRTYWPPGPGPNGTGSH